MVSGVIMPLICLSFVDSDHGIPSPLHLTPVLTDDETEWAPLYARAAARRELEAPPRASVGAP